MVCLRTSGDIPLTNSSVYWTRHISVEGYDNPVYREQWSYLGSHACQMSMALAFILSMLAGPLISPNFQDERGKVSFPADDKTEVKWCLGGKLPEERYGWKEDCHHVVVLLWAKESIDLTFVIMDS